MIKTFRHKGLRKFWNTGDAAGLDARMTKRITVRLIALHAATAIAELDVPGFDFHALQPASAGRYTIHVNGPWCITFTWNAGDAFDVDLENYH